MIVPVPPQKLKLYLETSVWNFIYADDAPEKRDAARAFFDELRQNEEVENLTNAYMEAKIGSVKAKPDMIHIAHATAHDLDVVVSWNLKHIVRLKTKMLVNGINKSLGYKEIQIVTP